MSESLIGRKYRISGQLLLGGLVVGLVTVGFGVQRGVFSPGIARILFAVILAAFALGYFVLRRKYWHAYASLPLSEQLEIDGKTYSILRRTSYWLKGWLVMIPILMLVSQVAWRSYDASARWVLFGIGVLYFGFTFLYLRGIRKSLKRLNHKLVQSPIGE